MEHIKSLSQLLFVCLSLTTTILVKESFWVWVLSLTHMPSGDASVLPCFALVNWVWQYMLNCLWLSHLTIFTEILPIIMIIKEHWPIPLLKSVLCSVSWIRKLVNIYSVACITLPHSDVPKHALSFFLEGCCKQCLQFGTKDAETGPSFYFHSERGKRSGLFVSDCGVLTPLSLQVSLFPIHGQTILVCQSDLPLVIRCASLGRSDPLYCTSPRLPPASLGCLHLEVSHKAAVKTWKEALHWLSSTSRLPKRLPWQVLLGGY